jgi:hypothetical protein
VEAHKLKAAKAERTLRKYPWSSRPEFGARLRKFSPTLHGVLDGTILSFYRPELKLAVARRVNPKLRRMENAMAGYYGPCGETSHVS